MATPTLSASVAEATVEAYAVFYPMADGGSNAQFWTDRLGSLEVGDHKFMVRL